MSKEKGPTPALDLSTERKVYNVRIDGEDYAMIDAADLPFEESLWISSVQQRLVRQIDSYSKEGAVKVAGDLDRVVKLILPGLPDGVMSKLGTNHKTAILNAWGAAYGEDEDDEGNPTGSSPDSKDSTAETQAPG